MKDFYDCHGGPGSTEPACGACVTCLHRVIEAKDARIKQLEETGEVCHAALGFADDDIREHLQVANYNLHGQLYTGERTSKPDRPQIIHQAGIDASVNVRGLIRAARLAWRAAKEAKP